MRLTSMRIVVAVICLAVLGAVEAAGEDRDLLRMYAHGDYQQVVDLLEPIERQGKANIQQRVLLGRSYLHLEQFDKALAALEPVLLQDGDNAEANALAGQALFLLGRYEQAVGYLKTAYRLKSEPHLTSAVGQCYFQLGQFAEAKRWLEESLREGVRNPTNRLTLGKLHLRRGSGASAEKYLLMAQEGGLESVQLHLLLGQAYVLQRKFVGPVVARRITGSPGRVEVVGDQVVIAKLPTGTDRYQVCTRYCALYEGLQVLRSQPKQPEALYMTASGWFATGQYDLAKQHLARLRAVETSPRVSDLSARLAIVVHDFAGLDTIVNVARQHRHLDPRAVADLYYQAALVLRSASDYTGAVALLEKADHQYPASANVLRSLASLSRTMGNHGKALRYYRRLVDLFPDALDIDELRQVHSLLEEKKASR